MERQRQHTLQPRDHTCHHIRLVDLRQADIDIQNMRAAVLLREALGQDIFNVVFAQRRLKFALAGRVDALTNDDRRFADLDRL